MLRRMKVGTKLFVILLAPVIVIVALVGVGVKDRRASASDAARVERLSSFALVGTDLLQQLQLEQLRSAVFSASKGTAGAAELQQQRERTDAAVARYRAAIADLDPGAPDGALAVNLDFARSRLNSLEGTRGGVDNQISQPFTIADGFDELISSFVSVNAALPAEAEDPALLLGLDALARVQQVQESQNAEATLLVATAQQGGFTDRIGALCANVAVDCESYSRVLSANQAYERALENLDRSSVTEAQKKALNGLDGGAAYRDLYTTMVSQGTNGNQVTVTGDQALTTSVTALQGLSGFDDSLTNQVVSSARDQEQQASRSVLLYLFAGAVGLAIAFAIAVVVARSITRPLSKLTGAARVLSDEQLPALVEQLRNPESSDAEAVAETLTPIEVESSDEIGELADAFNTIQAVTIDVAEEQGRLLRKGIGDIFVNLARRNQSLLDRQIEFIDQLETSERDPDQLENLFRLDHLATRMRRNAESLLVMAGADPPRRRGQPVPVADVVRVAIGEVEDYQRVHLLALDDATVAANVAADLAHLLSELMENATNSSPPHTSVEVYGGYDGRNGYTLTVADRGIGMSAEQMAEANHNLAHPPAVGLVISRSLGLTVVGRLAARYDLTVELSPHADGGVVATVELPYGLVEYPGDDAPESPSALEVMAAAGGRSTRPGRPIRPESVTVAAGPAPAAPAPAADGVLPTRTPTVAPAPAPAPTTVPAATPTGLPRRGQAAPAPVEAPAPAPAAPPAAAPAAPPAAAPVEAPAPAAPAPSLTAAGLVRRTPAARTAPTAGAAPATPTRAVTRTSRSPEEVRRMLSRYRSGLDRGRTGGPDATTPDAAPDTTEPPTRGAEQ